MSHHVPAELLCARIGCVNVPTEPMRLCRHHWLELAEMAVRFELDNLRRVA